MDRLSRYTALLLLLLIPAPLLAQSVVTGGVVVTVSDTTGALLIGATCMVQDQAQAPVPVPVDADGRCRLDGLAPGQYRVAVTLLGFESRILPVEVIAGRVSQTTVTLAPARLAEAVVVSATRMPTPVTALPNTVTIIDQSVIEQRTAASDDLASLLEANVPGFGPSLKKLTGRGESLRGRNPLYTINGVPQHTPLRDGERDGQHDGQRQQERDARQQDVERTLGAALRARQTGRALAQRDDVGDTNIRSAIGDDDRVDDLPHHTIAHYPSGCK